MIDLLPSNANPVIDLAPFDAAMASYAAAVKDMDAYSAGHPNAFFVFESQPRSLLGKLRDFQEKFDRARGDARRAAGLSSASSSAQFRVQSQSSAAAGRGQPQLNDLSEKRATYFPCPTP